MKKFRKIMAVLVAAMMIISSFTLTAFADGAKTHGRVSDTRGTISIENAHDGETYNVYEIFTLLSYNDSDNTAGDATHHTTDKYSYGLLSTSAWKPFFEGTKPATGWDLDVWGTDYITLDTSNPIIVDAMANFTAGGTYYPLTYTNKLKALVPDETTIASSISGVSAGIQEFARALKAFIAYATAKNLTVPAAADSITATSTNGAAAHQTDDGTVTIEFDDLELGYYLVDSTVGTLCGLDTTNAHASIKEKNSIPTIDKKVLEKGTAYSRAETTNLLNNSDKYIANTDARIGGTVTFMDTVTVPRYAKTPYTLYDVMEDGLLLASDDGEIEVYYTSEMNAAGATTKMAKAEMGADKDYTVSLPTSGTRLANNASFSITFSQAFLEKFNDFSFDDKALIQVVYDATLTKKAVIFGETVAATANETTISPVEDGPATLLMAELDDAYSIAGMNTSTGQIKYERNADSHNDNYAILTYGNGSSTRWAQASVDTYAIDVIKITEENDLLAGAVFEIYESDAATNDTIPQLVDGKTAIGFVTAETPADTAQSGASAFWALRDAAQVAASTSTTAEFTTVASTKLNFRGLDAGTYYIREKTAPEGYNAIPGLIKVVITGNTNGSSPTESQLTITMPNTNPTDVIKDWKGQINTSTGKYDSMGVAVTNKTNKELPSTGGAGTTVLYIVGGMLVILAGAYLFFSRKRTA